MNISITLKFGLCALLLVLYPETESQWVPRPPPLPISPPPLCASQYALVNHACATLPFTPVPPLSPPASASPSAASNHRHSPSDGSNHRHSPSDGSNHRHSPSDGSNHTHSPSDGSNHRQHQRHGHRHARHGHQEAHREHDCCRWLRELDSICVCDLLVRLPPFLSRPIHNYTVIVDESCHVTFQCGSSWVRA